MVNKKLSGFRQFFYSQNKNKNFEQIDKCLILVGQMSEYEKESSSQKIQTRYRRKLP